MNLRIAVSVEEGTNENQIVAEHFGKCKKFNIYEFDNNKVLVNEETYPNPISGEHNGVCQLPYYVEQFKVSVIIAGGMGQKAISNFETLGIEVITAPGMSCNTALELYLNGKLNSYEPCKNEHSHHH